MLDANRANWDERVPIHARSRFYDVAGFKAGASSLTAVELAELGDVAGKSLLHLQCHFGLDTLSWARRGAKVTGVDFSRLAVLQARAIARPLRIPATFVESNVYDLPQVLHETFDIVFTSYGVLAWLPDVWRWARVVRAMLAPGGTFYMVEFHPVAGMLDDQHGGPEPRLAYPYFGTEAERVEPGGEGSYADPAVPLKTPHYEWQHTLGDIITSLLDAGLSLEFVHEFPFSAYQMRPAMVKGDDGWWRLPGPAGLMPLMFSVKARG